MKKKKLLIGYQGIVGSNSETAAQLLFKNIYNENKYECELVPLTTSAKVFEALFTDKIDLGVVATRNSTCGNVMESMEALKKWQPEFVGVTQIPIHHCVFFKE